MHVGRSDEPHKVMYSSSYVFFSQYSLGLCLVNSIISQYSLSLRLNQFSVLGICRNRDSPFSV